MGIGPFAPKHNATAVVGRGWEVPPLAVAPVQTWALERSDICMVFKNAEQLINTQVSRDSAEILLLIQKC